MLPVVRRDVGKDALRMGSAVFLCRALGSILFVCHILILNVAFEARTIGARRVDAPEALRRPVHTGFTTPIVGAGSYVSA